MHRNTRLWMGGSLLAVVVVLSAAQFLPGVGAEPAPAPAQAQQPLTPEDLANLQHATSLSQAFRTASNRVLPAVVTIRTESEAAQVRFDERFEGNIPEEFLNDPFFRRFLEEFPRGPRGLPRAPQQGMGSGIIIDASGVILTNNHVLRGGEKVTVRLHDGREFEAQAVKTDPRTDLAILRIDAGGPLPYAQLGNSDLMEIGDWVIAIGAPFRLQESVTAGIISGKSRVVGINQREEYLQTDAAINPGNSGGPLVNLACEVVGINTAISSTNGGYQGIGFAVPSNLARWVADQLHQHGEVKRAYLGVVIEETSSQRSKQLGLDRVEGVLVTELLRDGPAAKAGVEVGDVILDFAGKPVAQPSELQGLVERCDIGSQQKLTVLHNGERRPLVVEVAELPSRLPMRSEGERLSPTGVELDELGFTAVDLDENRARELGYEGIRGVLVERVERGSLADRAGIVAGSVITRIGQTPVESVEAFRDELRKHSLRDGLVLTLRTPEGSKILFLSR